MRRPVHMYVCVVKESCVRMSLRPVTSVCLSHHWRCRTACACHTGGCQIYSLSSAWTGAEKPEIRNIFMYMYSMYIHVHIYTVCMGSYIRYFFCTHCFLFLSSSVGVAMFALAFSAYKLRNTLCEENIKYRK